MNRKMIFVIVLALAVAAVLSLVTVSGENSFLKCSKPKVTVGEVIKFKVDFRGISDEEYGKYDLNLSIEPVDGSFSFGVVEDVDVTVNNRKGTCAVSYEALSFYDELNFTLKTDMETEEKTSYTVKANIRGENHEAVETLILTVLPPRQEKPGPDPGGGDDGDDSGKDVYKGSSDNYLADLKLAGYKMEQKFHKTRDTYFVKTGKSVQSLNVSATPCDRKAEVDIIGNDRISGDMSKILINVTAENGKVRVYRIYVLQEGDKGR
ncbi:MAG: hypothetical protein Q4A40_01870 [Bacillota bacterium]|nr:hypothetical protein [Bacillota bacterium]